MEDHRLPSPLVGLLKLKGIPDFDIRHKADVVEVTIFWKRSTTPADPKKKMKTTPKTAAENSPQADADASTDASTIAKADENHQSSPADAHRRSRRPHLADRRQLQNDLPPQYRHLRRPNLKSLRARCKSTRKNRQSLRQRLIHGACEGLTYIRSWPSI